MWASMRSLGTSITSTSFSCFWERENSQHEPSVLHRAVLDWNKNPHDSMHKWIRYLHLWPHQTNDFRYQSCGHLLTLSCCRFTLCNWHLHRQALVSQTMYLNSTLFSSGFQVLVVTSSRLRRWIILFSAVHLASGIRSVPLRSMGVVGISHHGPEVRVRDVRRKAYGKGRRGNMQCDVVVVCVATV